MRDQLYTYAMVKTLYDSGRDYVDCFWPFVLRALPKEGKFVTLEWVQQNIREQTGLDIPRHSLKTIIQRAVQNHYVVERSNKVALVAAGVTYLQQSESDQETSRRLNELVEDARCYLQQNYQMSLLPQKIHSAIERFIAEQLEFFEKFINPASTTTQVSVAGGQPRVLESALIEYFKEVERARPNLYATLRDVVCGSILSAILHTRSFSSPSKKFKHTTAYLDSNFLFSLLGLHFDEYAKPAKELFSLMRAEGVFEFMVFDFTIEEVVGVLRNYAREQHLYVPHIKVNSIYSSLRTAGMTPAAVRELIAKLDEKLLDLDIEIQQTEVTLRDYEPTDTTARQKLVRYKQWQNERAQNHDLAAIAMVEKLRSGSVRRVEKAKHIFLSSDRRLATFNFLECGHGERATIGEVVYDQVLTNILWLKNPVLLKQLPLSTIISMHSRELFVDRDVWKQFSETVEQLRRNGDISERDVAVLLYDSRVQGELRGFTREESTKINREWATEGIEAAKKRLDEGKEQELERIRRAFSDRVAQAELQANARFIDAMSGAKARLRREARKVTSRSVFFAWSTFMLLLIRLALFVAPLLVSNWAWLEPVIYLVGVVFFLVGCRWDLVGFRKSVSTWLFRVIYRWKLNNARLQELEDHYFGGPKAASAPSSPASLQDRTQEDRITSGVQDKHS